MADIVTSKRADMGFTVVTILNYGLWQDRPRKGADMPKRPGADIQSDMQADIKPDTYKNEKKSGGNDGAPRGRPRSARGNGKANPEAYQETVDLWFPMFEEAKGARPTFDKAEGECLKRVLTAHGPEKVRRLIRHLLYHSRLPWIVDHHRYSIKSLAGSWNELASEEEARRRVEGES